MVMSKMTVAEYLVSVLEKENIDTVFGYPGGNITYVIDAIDRSNVSYVQSYNEQGAAFAANAYGAVSEKFGVAISSSGPGAINMLNGIANAYYDSIPCLFVTGNVSAYTMKGTDPVRQKGFQETDIVSIASSITKYAKTVFSAEEAVEALHEALAIMKDGRKGPVLIDIPHNVQRAEVAEGILENNCVEGFKENSIQGINKPTIDVMENFVSDLQSAKRPSILVGNGARSKEAKELIAKLTEQLKLPVFSSLLGIDVMDNSNECYVGMIGSYGLSYVNDAIRESDLILVLGSRLDERQVADGAGNKLFENAKIYHVDIDENELGYAIEGENKVHCTVEAFLEGLIDVLFRKTAESGYSACNYDNQSMLRDYNKWWNRIEQIKAENITEYLMGENVARAIREAVGTGDNTVVCVDVGKHQMATAQAVRLGKDSRYLNSAGLGSMGYAIPAAIGAYYANPKAQVVAVVGDGGLMMNLQELQVINRERLPIKIIVVNNEKLELISDYQDKVFDGRRVGSEKGYSVVKLENIARAFEFEYVKINLNLQNADFLENCELPCLCEFIV